MKCKFWFLGILLLLLSTMFPLPSAQAETTPTATTFILIQDEKGFVDVAEQDDWQVGDNASYEPAAHFYVASGAQNLTVILQTADGGHPALAAQRIKSEGGFDLYRVDLATAQPTPTNGSRYHLTIAYRLIASAVPAKTYYALPSLVIFARSEARASIQSDFFTDFVPIGLNDVHAARTNVPANQTFTISFVSVPAASSSVDQTKYLWGGLGLLLGIVFMIVAVRAGWVSLASKAKFVKGGQMESKTMLEARRRTLLAALKELEQAHDVKEVPDDAYAPLKEEYKAQAVRVMRSLEEKKEP